MNIPARKEIEELWDEYKVPYNVRNHIKQVTKIAVFLAKKLKEAGVDINVELVEASALLHDLARAANFKNFTPNKNRTIEPTKEELGKWAEMKEKYGSMHHGDIFAEIFKDKYPEIGEIVKKHRYRIVGTPEGPQTWEEKIVNYADKRVAHDKIVTIQERHEEAAARYPEIKTKENREKELKQLEDEIFAKLDIQPEDLKDLIQ